MENQVCPICGAKENHLFTEKKGFRVLRCRHCGGLFVGNAPTDTAGIYGQDYFWGAEDGFGYVDYDADKEAMRPVFKKCLNVIQLMIGRKGSLLDVGAATGYFMALAQNDGWQTKGVEVGALAADAGRKKGLEIVTGTIADLPSHEKFDVITMFDVIEHIRTPEYDLRKARELLNKNGALVIITPDAGSLFARLLGKKWHHIVPPEHLTYFSRKGIRTLLQKTGFEVVEIKIPGKWFGLAYILHTLLRWQKLSIWRWTLRFVDRHPKLANFRLPTNFGDNMLIYARAR